MANKRKASGSFNKAEASGETGFEKKGGKMGPITTFEDVADSEDEFHVNRDKVLLDDGPDAKRRRKYAEEDAALELSDEEVLGYSSEGSDEAGAPQGRPKPSDVAFDEDDPQQEEDGEEEGWGTSRKDYYNNDEIQTEADALEEEAEAKRLQQKKLQKMSEADFGFDESEWLNACANDEEAGVVTEVLKDVEITPDMDPKERFRILQTRYPEFEFLANEFGQLQPVLADLQLQVVTEGEGSSKSTSHTLVKSRALAAYVASLAMYFAILTSPAKGLKSEGKALDPAELRDHAVMENLLQCRELWSKIQKLKTPKPVEHASEYESTEETQAPLPNNASPASKKSKKQRALIAAAATATEEATLRAQRLEEAEASLAGLSSHLAPRRASKKPKAPVASDDSSDFGEEETMDAKSAEEKANKRKSLRFYTSQITQKASRRAGAGRDAGGDADLPHRERLRDRQARLNAEAEKRGRKLDGYGRGGGGGGADLGGDSDSGEDAAAVKVRDEADGYYDMVARVSQSKKADRERRRAALAQAQAEGGLARVVEAQLDEEGKRAIGYVIEKNKGLAPKRKKEVRNPRVKKRMRYEEKKRKLASTRAVYKGGEEKGGYGGEKTGIKTGLVKSIRLG
ncbi:hypothetical protein B2J93_575 [Marssonina coronariae]|uniref:Sas10 C-terminal domain-containing protein n=1 Tax=Diplocarpon coronariae TaxID=2795749 RepID=A0A218ZCK6_9HELO|nr:hypothetical protein B2J93_575 [Marssonina coronariae]